VARRATKIAEERSTKENVLLLDAGDSLVGDQDPARTTQGRTSVDVMNRLGYDAMTLGPNDLALGLAVLRQRMAEAQFAVLSANAIEKATGELVAAPYVVAELAGYRVAIIGLSGGESAAEIVVQDPLATAQAVVAEVKGQADVIILLSHAGPEMDLKIADTVPGIAAIVSGGPGAQATPIVSAVTGTPIYHVDAANPGHAGRRLGAATLVINPDGTLKSQTWQPWTLGPEIAADPIMAAWVAEQLRQ